MQNEEFRIENEECVEAVVLAHSSPSILNSSFCIHPSALRFPFTVAYDARELSNQATQ